MKKILSIILSVVLMLTMFPATIATEYMPTTLEAINRYRPNDDISFSIVAEKLLNSFSDKNVYTFYALSPYGYAILYNETNGLMEACYSEKAVLPIDVDDDSCYYYGGPGVYCILQNNSYFNTFDETYFNAEMLTSTIEAEKLAQEYEIQKACIERASTANSISTVSTDDTSTMRTASVQYTYFSNLVEYGTNQNGTCTVIAAAMLLGYYDNFINDFFVWPVYENNGGTNEAFHQVLNNYVYGTSAQGGIYIHDAADGINQYLEDQSLSCILVSEDSSTTAAINKTISKLESGQPVIASMKKSLDALYNHTVLVYSVTYNTSDPVSTAVFTMNMGWHDGTRDGQSKTEYVASAGWFYECGYIEGTCTSHTLNTWYDYSIYNHCRNCTACTYIEFEAHNAYWDSLRGICTRCGRTGNSGSVIYSRIASAEHA